MYYLTFVYDYGESWGFTCPDIPGFAADIPMRDFSDAVVEARAILASHLATLLDAGGNLPTARNLGDIRNDPKFAEDFDEAATTIMLPALVPAGRTMRVNLSFDENTLGLIDEAAKVRSLTRSAFLAEAARRYAEA